jgi:hypothetical protein
MPRKRRPKKPYSSSKAPRAPKRQEDPVDIFTSPVEKEEESTLPAEEEPEEEIVEHPPTELPSPTEADNEASAIPEEPHPPTQHDTSTLATSLPTSSIETSSISSVELPTSAATSARTAVDVGPSLSSTLTVSPSMPLSSVDTGLVLSDSVAMPVPLPTPIPTSTIDVGPPSSSSSSSSSSEASTSGQEEEEKKAAVKVSPPSRAPSPAKKPGDLRGQAAMLFRCSYGKAGHFCRDDPFNPSINLAGFICKDEGPMDGSLYITHVNGQKLASGELIYGTPKLEYPYKDNDDGTYKNLNSKGQCTSFLLENKWNGTNILIFKYRAHGKTYISGKTKGSPFLSNSPYGAFADLTREVLGLGRRESIDPARLPPLLSELANPDIQSISFEICGNTLPHLVKYSFDVDLKPLFKTYMDGSIAPIFNASTDYGPFTFTQSAVEELCKKCQQEDLSRNESYRKSHHLIHKYEHNHFATEGRVLYLLNRQGRLINRTMYKIKPRDVEQVHWGRFDVVLQGRVREAMEKIEQREKLFDKDTLRKELDMGPKEWGKFGGMIWRYACRLKEDWGKIPKLGEDERRLLLISGYPGSGRDRLAEWLKPNGWIIARGDYEACKLVFERNAFKPKLKLAIDTPNLKHEQRKKWIDEAKKYGLLDIRVVYFSYTAEECKQRIESLAEEKAKRVKWSESQKMEEEQIFQTRQAKPKEKEGFSQILVVQSEEDLKKLRKL